MQSNGRRILLTVMSIMVVLAMVTLWPTESQAQGTVTPATRPRPVSVPEPSTSVLLLLGIGLTGLAGYSLKCLKQGE